MVITTHLLLTLLGTTAATTEGISDLCSIVEESTGGPRYCEPHRAGAPIFDGDVCCGDTLCSPTLTGGCPTGQKRFYCEFGEQLATGGFACYFEVPEYCDVFPCEPKPPPGFSWYPQAEYICCEYGICVPLVHPYCEEENIYHCSSLVCNNDGTVTCIDWE